MSAQGDKYRNRPEEDLTTRRTAEDELMRGDRGETQNRDGAEDRDDSQGRGLQDRGVGQTGEGSSGGSGTAGGGMENEGTGSLLVGDAGGQGQNSRDEGRTGEDDDAGSGSTKGGREPGVSGQRGMTGGLEKEGEGHSGPIRSGSGKPSTKEGRPGNQAADGNDEDNAREGYEDHGGSRDADGTRGESSGSRPGYR